jgi:hypothetical protein
MHNIVLTTIVEVVKVANFISIFWDEIINVDNQSWLSLHVYVI